MVPVVVFNGTVVKTYILRRLFINDFSPDDDTVPCGIFSISQAVHMNRQIHGLGADKFIETNVPYLLRQGAHGKVFIGCQHINTGLDIEFPVCCKGCPGIVLVDRQYIESFVPDLAG